MKRMRNFRLSAVFLLTVTATASGQGGGDARATEPERSKPLQAPFVVDLKASDGTLLKASYFAAANPGPGVLLLHQINRTRKAWDDVAGQLAAAGINTLTLDMRGFGESGGKPCVISWIRARHASVCLAILIQRSTIWFRSQGSSAMLSAWEEPGYSVSTIPSRRRTGIQQR
jgi:pimeloyl-ACP methyl ester carboxylesterase